MGKILDLRSKAIANNIPIMQDDGINFIIDYIKKNNVLNILEIGSAIGYSAINFASVNASIKVVTIERDIKRYNEALINIQGMNLENQIEIINADALEIEIDSKFDLIFIDAAKSQYIKFFLKFKNNLSNKGVIITDNLSFHGMVEDISKTNNRNTRQLVGKIKKYIEFLKDNEEFETEFYDIGDKISVSRLKK